MIGIPNWLLYLLGIYIKIQKWNRIQYIKIMISFKASMILQNNEASIRRIILYQYQINRTNMKIKSFIILILILAIAYSAKISVRRLQSLNYYIPLINYSSDANFSSCDSLLRNTFSSQLAGAIVVNVSTQNVAGINYKIAYSSSQGTFEGVVFYQSWTQTLAIVTFTNTTGNSNSSIVIAAYTNLNNWQNDTTFRFIDNFARGSHPNQLSGATVISVMTQAVNGINYKINYVALSITYQIVINYIASNNSSSVIAFSQINSSSTSNSSTISFVVQSILTVLQNNNIFCQVQKFGICLQCYYPAVLINGCCVITDSLCIAYDSTNTQCLQCQSGYTPLASKCIQNNYMNCLSISNNTCVQCSSQYILNPSNVCVKIQNNCQSYDQNGNCLSCVSPFNLSNGQCA